MKKSSLRRGPVRLGAPAVPWLVKVLGEAHHLANVTGATHLLARIDMEEAASAVKEAVKRTDPPTGVRSSAASWTRTTRGPR